MNVLLWIVQILLALLFLFAGSMKYMMPYEEMTVDAPVALPYALILFIGGCEILGAIGLIVPWATKIKAGLTPTAAALLAVIMTGATIITAIGSPAMAVVPAIVGLLCIFVFWGRRKNLGQ